MSISNCRHLKYYQVPNKRTGVRSTIFGKSVMEYALLGTLYAIALWDTCQCVLLFGSTIIVVNKMLYALCFCWGVCLLGACTQQILGN